MSHGKSILSSGVFVLPILCALKVMLHKRRGEYQESVWEQVMGQVWAVDRILTNPQSYIKLSCVPF